MAIAKGNGHSYRPLPFDVERMRVQRARRRRIAWVVVFLAVVAIAARLVF